MIFRRIASYAAIYFGQYEAIIYVETFSAFITARDIARTRRFAFISEAQSKRFSTGTWYSAHTTAIAYSERVGFSVHAILRSIEIVHRDGLTIVVWKNNSALQTVPYSARLWIYIKKPLTRNGVIIA